jgi:putative FmdB family regulatory protein
MPLYDFTCQECGRQSELLVSASSQPDCPECGSSRMTKMLPIVAAQTRGDSASQGSQGSRPQGSCGSGCGCHPH